MTPAEGTWTITDHVCRQCLGRVLQRGTVFRCAMCGAEGQGEPAAICACGIAAPRLHGRPLFRCGPNPAPAAGEPGEAQIVVLFDG